MADSNGVGIPFQPVFTSKVASASKNGEVVEFFIESTKVGSVKSTVVIRVHEDFLWLLHCLKTQDGVKSIIFPPLPTAPATSLQAAEKKTKKQAGEKTRVLVGDDFGDNCRAYEKFLDLCIKHPRLGHSQILENFAFEKQAPQKVKVRRNILEVFTKTVDDFRLANFKDHDENFQQIRESNKENINHMKTASDQFQDIVMKEKRISNTYQVLDDAIKELSKDPSNTTTFNAILEILENSLDHAHCQSEANAENRQRSLGSTLQLYSGFSKSIQEMLQKRVHKMAELENAKKNYEKAKPPKKQQAEETMKKLDHELRDLTELAKPEIERHNRQRLLTMQKALVHLAESEIKNARDSLAVYTKLCADIQKLEL